MFLRIHKCVYWSEYYEGQQSELTAIQIFKDFVPGIPTRSDCSIHITLWYFITFKDHLPSSHGDQIVLRLLPSFMVGKQMDAFDWEKTMIIRVIQVRRETDRKFFGFNRWAYFSGLINPSPRDAFEANKQFRSSRTLRIRGQKNGKSLLPCFSTLRSSVGRWVIHSTGGSDTRVQKKCRRLVVWCSNGSGLSYSYRLVSVKFGPLWITWQSCQVQLD